MGKPVDMQKCLTRYIKTLRHKNDLLYKIRSHIEINMNALAYGNKVLFQAPKQSIETYISVTRDIDDIKKTLNMLEAINIQPCCSSWMDMELIYDTKSYHKRLERGMELYKANNITK